MDWQVVLPIIGPPFNAQDCIESMGPIDVPVLVVDNSPLADAFASEWDGVDIEGHPENLGVAASWNRGLDQGADKTLIVSASIRFGKGGLRRVIDYASKHINEFGIQFGGYPNRPDGLWNVGWKLIAFRRQMIDLVGRFDENYWPAYFEDLDFSYRTYLALGEKDRRFPLAQGDIEAIGATKIGDSIAVKNGYGFPPGVRASGDVVRDYFIEKWGGPSCEEKYRHPFNDPMCDHRFWPSPPRRVCPGPGE